MKRLFDALADLDERGGVSALAAAETWTEAEVARVVGDMRLIRHMLWAEIIRFRDNQCGPAP